MTGNSVENLINIFFNKVRHKVNKKNKNIENTVLKVEVTYGGIPKISVWRYSDYRKVIIKGA